MSELRRTLVDHIPNLRRFAYALLRDRTLADDLVQETLSRALDKESQYRDGTNLRAWLFSIMRSVFVSDGRRFTTMRKNQELNGERATSTPANQADTIQLKELELNIAALPEGQREVLLLVGLEGMGYDEAAQVLNVPIGTVRSRLSRARETLRQETLGLRRTHRSSEEEPVFQQRGQGE